MSGIVDREEGLSLECRKSAGRAAGADEQVRVVHAAALHGVTQRAYDEFLPDDVVKRRDDGDGTERARWTPNGECSRGRRGDDPLAATGLGSSEGCLREP